MATTCPSLFNLASAARCLPDFGGISGEIMFCEVDDITVTLNDAPTETETSVLYSSISVKNGKLYKLDLQYEKSKITGTLNPDTGGYESVLEAVYKGQSPETASLNRAFAMKKMAFFSQREDGRFAVFYQPLGRLRVEVNSDSGAASSDAQTTTLKVTNNRALADVEYAAAVVEAPVAVP